MVVIELLFPIETNTVQNKMNSLYIPEQFPKMQWAVFHTDGNRDLQGVMQTSALLLDSSEDTKVQGMQHVLKVVLVGYIHFRSSSLLPEKKL